MPRGFRTRAGLIIAALVILGVGVYVAVALLRAVPPVTLTTLRVPRTFPGRRPALAWPSAGQASVGVQGVGVVASRHSDQPVPIASVAKVMTAYVVLRDHPLRPGEDGPLITVTPSDEAIYRADLALGQSTAKVRAGERLTERQALEALLLPSANNVASLLAEWDAGSEAAFVNKMNDRARGLGMVHTRYVDASGFQPETVSTARDQVHLVMAALRTPALVRVMGIRQVRLPVAGTVHNLDALLGKAGVIGGKTGTTSHAGGCFVFAARRLVGRTGVTVVGAVLGQPAAVPTERTLLDAVFGATTALLRSTPGALRMFTNVVDHRPFARLTAPWARPVPVRLARVPGLIGWPGLRTRIRILAARYLRAPVYAGQRVGTVLIRAGGQRARVALVATRDVPKPSLGWRLRHP